MPQTTNAVPQACARIDIATDDPCATWVNVSGSANSIQNTTQTKMVADEFTFDGIGPISEAGKLEAFDITVRIVFTNVVTEAYRIVRDVFKEAACAGKLCIRWIPSGAVGGDGFQTNRAPVTSFDWPPVDSSTAGPVMVSFVLHVSTIDPFVFVS